MIYNKSMTATVYVINDNKILLHQHKKYKTWFPLGGHIESDEFPHEAAIREAKEEAGVDITLVETELAPEIELARVVRIPAPFCILHEGVGGVENFLDFIFIAETGETVPHPANNESKEFKWFTYEELLAYEIKAMIKSEITMLLDNFFGNEEDKSKYRQCIGNLVEKCIIIPELNELEIETYKINKYMRNSIHIFSMSESYDLDNMWGYYSDSGKGFCIEYDFNKINDLSDDCKKLLLKTYKVSYSSSHKCFDIEAFVEFYFFKNYNPVICNRLMSSRLAQIISKDITWEHEREWRVVLENIKSKVFIDIVSGIIIDCRSINKTNAKKLIRLCKQKGWSIKVRCSNPFDNTHFFIDYYEYMKAFGEK